MINDIVIEKQFYIVHFYYNPNLNLQGKLSFKTLTRIDNFILNLKYYEPQINKKSKSQKNKLFKISTKILSIVKYYKIL